MRQRVLAPNIRANRVQPAEEPAHMVRGAAQEESGLGRDRDEAPDAGSDGVLASAGEGAARTDSGVERDVGSDEVPGVALAHERDGAPPLGGSAAGNAQAR